MAQETETPRAGDAALLAARQQATGVLLSQDIQFADGQAGQSMAEAKPEPDIFVTVDIEVPPELAGRAQELQDRVNRSTDKAGAVQQARQELIGLVDAHNRKEAAELAEVKAEVSHKAEIAAHHRELYANDHEYRVITDMTIGRAKDRIDQLDARQGQVQDIAKKHGLSVPFGNDLADARAAYEDAVRNGDPDAILSAAAKLHEIARQQAEELERQLRARGQHGDADKVQGIGKGEGDALGDALRDHDTWAKGYIDALRRKLAKDGLSAEEETYLEEKQREINEKRQSALHAGDATLVTRLTNFYRQRNEPETEVAVQVHDAHEVASRLPPAALAMIPGLGAGIQGAYVVPEPAPAALEEPSGKFVVAEATTGEKSPVVITGIRPASKDSGMTPVV